jgi:tRNA(fMet)-specific endonuclease VapC
MFCLDTNVVIGVMTKRAPRLEVRLEAEIARGTALFLSSIVVYELSYGAAKSAHKVRNLARIQDFLVAVPTVAPFDPGDAAEAGDIRAHLEGTGQPIGPHDILIAAQARRRDAALVTLNRREFERVPGLIVTDWGV